MRRDAVFFAPGPVGQFSNHNRLDDQQVIHRKRGDPFCCLDLGLAWWHGPKPSRPNHGASPVRPRAGLARTVCARPVPSGKAGVHVPIRPGPSASGLLGGPRRPASISSPSSPPPPAARHCVTKLISRIRNRRDDGPQDRCAYRVAGNCLRWPEACAFCSWHFEWFLGFSHRCLMN